MAATSISRNGTFDLSKVGALSPQLIAAGLPAQHAIYGTDTGFRVEWPAGLTAPQVTTATSVINAYVEPTDVSTLSPLQLQAFNFLQIANPTQAQSLAALRGIIKWALQYSTGRTNIDGTSIE